MATSYDAWARFDVEKELERIDERTVQEEKEQEQHRRIIEKQVVEDTISQSAQQSAEVLAARARVAALKAKGRTRRRGKQMEENQLEENTVSITSASVEDGKVEQDKVGDEVQRLQYQSELFKRKHDVMQQILEHRRRGDKILHEKQWEHAKESYQTALVATQELDMLVAKLSEVEQERKESVMPETEIYGESNRQVEQASTVSNKITNEHCGCEHSQKHSVGCSNSHHTNTTSKDLSKRKEMLPKENDLPAIVKMFFKDVYMGIGVCEFEQNHFAAAAEAFKEVLLRDDHHLNAWLYRGKAFARMEAPMLAMLHFSRITSLDSEHEEAIEALEHVKAKLLSADGIDSDTKSIVNAIDVRTQGLREILETIQLLFLEANVILIEGFFQYAISKYEAVLGCLDFVNTHQDLWQDMDKNTIAAIQQIQVACHVNIANGYYEMQKNYTKAIEHCEKALQLDRTQVMCHYRLGQLYRSLYKFEQSLQHFTVAKTLIGSMSMNTTPSGRSQLLSQIDKELDKSEFERSQYDMMYIRSLSDQQKH